MSDPIITIDRLRKVYEPFPNSMRLLLRTSVKEPVVALDDVSLQVHPGELVAVLGPNGAGKSTLFRILTGLTTPTSGSASVLGHDVTRYSPAVRRFVGFMPAENRTLLLRHSCKENLAFHGRLQGIDESELSGRIDETLDRVGLGHAGDRIGYALSTGMLARLMLARAILNSPPVLILDEPTGAVDPLGSYELLGLIQQIARDSGLAVLISSHRLDEVEMLNDRVMLLDRGKVVFSGDLSSMVQERVSNQVEIRVTDDTVAEDVAEALRGEAGIDDVGVEGSTILIRSDSSIGRIVQQLDGHVDSVVSIGTSRPPLRDVLAQMLRNQRSEEQ